MTNSETEHMTREVISLVFMVLFPLFDAGCYSFLYCKRQDLLVRKRNKPLIYVASLAGWLAYFDLIVSVYGGVPCALFYVASLLVAPLSVGPQLIRALTLRGTLEYSRLMIEEEISSRDKQNGGSSCYDHSPIPSAAKSSGPSNLLLTSENRRKANMVLEKTRKTVKATKWAMLFVPTLFLILALTLTSDKDQLLTTDFDRCQPEPTYFQYASPAFGVMSAALSFVATILAKQIDDELGLRKEITRNVVFLGCSYISIIVVRYIGYFNWQPILQTIQQMILSFSMAIMPSFPWMNFKHVASWASKQKKRINPATKSKVPGYARPIPKEHRGTRSSIKGVVGGRTSMTGLQSDQRDRETTMSWDAGLCILLSTQEGITSFSQHCAREFR